MADKTAIEWTEATWNPTTGCERISSKRGNWHAPTWRSGSRPPGTLKYQLDGSPITSGPGFGVTVHEDALDLPRSWRRPLRGFANGMSDLFHARVPTRSIEQAFAMMGETPQQT